MSISPTVPTLQEDPPPESQADPTHALGRAIAEEDGSRVVQANAIGPEGPPKDPVTSETAATPSEYKDLRDPKTGKPCFKPSELKLLATDVSELSAKRRKRRENLVKRASRYRKRMRESIQTQAAKSKELEAERAAANRFTGEEPYTIVNWCVEGLELAGVVPKVLQRGKDVLRFTDAEKRQLGPDTAAVIMTHWPELAGWLSGGTSAEVRLTVALLQIGLAKYLTVRAIIDADRAKQATAELS